MLWQSLVDSVYFFKNHFYAIAAIILPIAIPIELFDALYEYFIITEDSTYLEHSVPFIVMMLASPLYGIAVIFYIASVSKGEAISTQTAWQLGRKYWSRYLVLSILMMIVVMFGFMLLFIPGLIFITRYALAEFELLLNEKRPVEALKLSWVASGKYFWTLLGGFIILGIVLYIPLALLFSTVEESNQLDPVLDVIIGITFSVLPALVTIFSYRIYEQIVDNKNVIVADEATENSEN